MAHRAIVADMRIGTRRRRQSGIGYRGTMTGYKDQDFKERLTVAAKARKAMLERFRARPGLDDPAVAERRAAREAIHAAREVRLAERKAAREAEAARRATEKAASDAVAAREAAEQAAREAEAKAEQAVRDAARDAERKAARDARYAARKARR